MADIAVLMLDQARFSGAAAVLEVFQLCNVYAGRQYDPREDLPPVARAWLLSRDGRPVTLQGGRQQPVDAPADDARAYAGVYVAPFAVGGAVDLTAAADRAWAADWLRARHAEGAFVAASGSGVAVAAQAGLLDGHAAAVPWWLEKAFRRAYPRVVPEFDRILTEAGRVCCTGSMRGEPALAHRLAERVLSPNMAAWLRDVTLVDPDPDGSTDLAPYTPAVLRPDDLVGRARHWLQMRFTQKVRIADLAADMGVSERTLTRRFERSLGMTPLRFLQQIRIETAKQMLSRTDRKVDQIAWLVGYADAAFFKTLFRERTGRSPAAWREGASSP